MLAALTLTDWATIALASVTGVLALVAILQLFAFTRSEGRRTQPVVILHQRVPRGVDAFAFGVAFENRGAGTAYNVRGGVRLGGTEYPLGDADGDRYIVGAGEKVPGESRVSALSLQVPPWPYALVRGGPSVDSRAVFYARYENAFGKVWETLNPADPRASFKVRRAWFLLTRNAYQRRRRRSDERIVQRRNAEEIEAVESGRPIPLRRRVMRWFGR
jgi:hypothetical protein